ncbi:unnamed protein product (macronuclear) [Paramecium tetraurelia]|uniref:Uncharacterized protein n=1 Tax=Paramecium tetraurelia TaxID=5888 RepID=A0CWJ3_PARTE|nr:uncharacterized protein GSPATT00001363001 [Paramecium tetraurelia]CAK75160.1 unnamed protein product [Paramecium tetraurelia]|eukprot:XP_001442557.1 hypothetical protein (macronuclear) [Paramecium tetraurelia strain d4-2]
MKYHRMNMEEQYSSFEKTIDYTIIVKKEIQNDQDEDTGLLSEQLETCESHISSNSLTISNSQINLAQAQEQVGPLEQKLFDKSHQAEDKEGEEQRNK